MILFVYNIKNSDFMALGLERDLWCDDIPNFYFLPLLKMILCFQMTEFSTLVAQGWGCSDISKLNFVPPLKIILYLSNLKHADLQDIGR